jgi:cyclopropane fatty-acyl-phospholipid synthase-like methyltransferase
MNHFSVLTCHPIAYESRDHTQPGGTQHDNSRWHRFNEKLYAWLTKRPLRIMDLGCAGGGFVKDCIDDGHEAIGLEGSDFSLIRKRAEWATIPNNLFTCDITKPFTVIPALFDVVTAWEVMEHIGEADLPQLCRNVFTHLDDEGVWIMSVSTQVGDHHVTLHERGWWLDLLQKHGFMNFGERIGYFGEDFVRGTQRDAPQSFHIIVRKAKP